MLSGVELFYKEKAEKLYQYNTQNLEKYLKGFVSLCPFAFIVFILTSTFEKMVQVICTIEDIMWIKHKYAAH